MFQSKPTLHMKRTNKQTKTYLFEFGYHSGVSSCVSVFMIHHCCSVQVLPQSPILIVFIVYLQHKRICIGTIRLYKFVVMVKKTIITTALVLLLMCNADTLTKKLFFLVSESLSREITWLYQLFKIFIHSKEKGNNFE